MLNKDTLLQAGQIELKVVGINKILRPESFEYTENINTVCNSFNFSVPYTIENILPVDKSIEIKIYIDGSFLYGGFIVSSTKEEGSTSIKYSCLGYGYQLCNTAIVINNSYSDYKGTINSFIDNVISNNIKKVKKIFFAKQPGTEEFRKVSNNTFGKTLKNNQQLIQLTANIQDVYNRQSIDYSQIKFSYPIRFIIYDPNDLGKIKISTLLNQIPQEKRGTQSLFEYINSILKIDNLYIRCLGRYEDLKNNLSNSKLYNNKISNINFTFNYPKGTVEYDTEIKSEDFVLELWRPNIKSYSEAQKVIVSQKRNLMKKIEYLDINNQIGNSYDTALNLLGLEKYFNNTVKENIYFANKNTGQDKIVTLNYYPDNSKQTNILKGVGIHKDISNQADTYMTTKKTSNEDDIKKIQSNTIIVNNPNVGDGTTKIVDFGDTIRDTECLLNFEVNKTITTSNYYTVTVIGYKHNIFIDDIYNNINRKNKPFWRTRQTVTLNSPIDGLKNQLLMIDSMTMIYNKNEGCITKLKLVDPNAYSFLPYNVIDNERISQLVRQEYYKTQN